MPPSTLITWPVTYFAFSSARYTTMWATSSASPKWPCGMTLSQRAFCSSVSIDVVSVSKYPGATTLAELAAAGRPAVLIPYPFATDDHQRHNAEAVAAVGGATVVLDAALAGESLAATVGALLGDPARRDRMGKAVRTLARPDATARIADLAEALLDGDAVPAGDHPPNGSDDVS